ncbi:MAG: FMN-binding protein [Firmicutes bacterium]|nr:FMN-binding protein [Bacillota bacterium]
MKKKLKWIGIALLVCVAAIMIYAVLGMQQTLSLEINTVDLAGIPDGEYAGEYDCYRWTNAVIVSVENHQINDIQAVKGPTGRQTIRQELIAQILAEQTPALDAVSGATADQKAFLKAVETALSNAH